MILQETNNPKKCLMSIQIFKLVNHSTLHNWRRVSASLLYYNEWISTRYQEFSFPTLFAFQNLLGSNHKNSDLLLVLGPTLGVSILIDHFGDPVPPVPLQQTGSHVTLFWYACFTCFWNNITCFYEKSFLKKE